MKHRMKLATALGILLTLSIFITYGCDSATEPNESGTLRVKVTDAPFPADFVESAVVTIDSIEIRQKGGTEESSYLVISNTPIDFNLLELRNGVTASLADIEIPVGSYDLVRLYVENAKIVLKNGLGEFNLKVPSGEQTGIKIFIKPEIQIQGGLTAELLMDFDLSKSFTAQGNYSDPSGISGFHFKPVLRAVNNSEAGSIFGTVTDENGLVLEGVLVTVTLGEESATAITDENGYYEIPGIMAGEYTVSAILEGYNKNIAPSVGVTANNKTEQNFVLIAN